MLGEVCAKADVDWGAKLDFRSSDPLPNYREDKLFPVDTIKEYRGSGSPAPLILRQGARWKCVVNYTPRTVYLWK